MRISQLAVSKQSVKRCTENVAFTSVFRGVYFSKKLPVDSSMERYISYDFTKMRNPNLKVKISAISRNYFLKFLFHIIKISHNYL